MLAASGHDIWLSSALKIGKILLLSESYLRNLKINIFDSKCYQVFETLVIHRHQSNYC